MSLDDKIKALEEKRGALESQLVVGISELERIAIHQRIIGIANVSKEIAIMTDPWAWHNMSAQIFLGSFCP